ncbi:MAG: archaellin/type IV pilin N-terminal domain-containing protein [Zestosphaera sp.]
MKTYKGISPILATVILIAVTLIIAIAVIGWIMGVWGSMGGPSESLVVTGSSATCSGSSLEFEVSITNKGTADAVISRVEVLGLEAPPVSLLFPKARLLPKLSRFLGLLIMLLAAV